MRRVFVIFLILLFPLNVLALSMSVSLPQSGTALAEASMQAMPEAGPADSFGCERACDLDPVEPPGHLDLHDIVNHESPLRLAGVGERDQSRHDACRPCRSTPPPVKPPRP